MPFKFYIDTFLTDQPDNGTELITTIKRDSDLGGFLTTQDVTLQYSANNDLEADEISGYAYLKSKFDSGTCNEVNVTIYDEISATETYLVYTGVMKVPSMIIQEGAVNLSTKIDDNNFYSYIRNNKNIQFSQYATKTKNGEPITPTQIYEVDMFYGQTGTYLSSIGLLYRGYRIYDILKFLVPAISDNKVTFESDYLSTSTTQLFLFNGSALAYHDTQPNVNVSFDQIIKELFKLKNLSFYIDQTDPVNPVLRLEEETWFYVNTNILTFDEPKEIKTSIKSTKLYGTIKVGSTANPGGSAPVYTFNAGTSYFGWKEEVYTPYGQCNTSVELDLVNEFHISNNAINDQVSGAVDGNLDTLFIVECDDVDTGAFTAKAVAYEIYGNGSKRFYNVGLNNVNKIALHGSNFQSALTNTQDVGTDICHVELGTSYTLMDQNPGSGSDGTVTTPVIKSPIPFADEFGGINYDSGNNFNNVIGYYQAPAPGNYSFKMNMVIESGNLKSCITELNTVVSAIDIATIYGVDATFLLGAYTDNTFSTLIGYQSKTIRITDNGIFDYPVAFTAALPTGAVVIGATVMQLIILFPTIFGNTPITPAVIYGGLCGYTAGEPKIFLEAQSDSSFECNGTPDGGLVLAQPDPEVYKIKLHEFQYDISASDFRQVQALPIGSFDFVKDGVTRSGYIEQLTYNNWTGRAQIKLITNATT